MQIETQSPQITANLELTQFKVQKIFGLSFFLTGIFAFIGSIYTWGNGFLFTTPNGTDVSVYIADFLITFPLSILAGIGIWNNKHWGLYLGWITSGVYIYGSILVYAMVFQQGTPYALHLMIPPIFGISISIGYIVWSRKKFRNMIK